VEKDTREKIAFALNFVLPGLGIVFSGFIHRLRWLWLVGFGLIAGSLLLGVHSLASYHLYILLTSQNFDILNTLFSLAIGFIIAFLGAVVEHEIKEEGLDYERVQ